MTKKFQACLLEQSHFLDSPPQKLTEVVRKTAVPYATTREESSYPPPERFDVLSMESTIVIHELLKMIHGFMHINMSFKVYIPFLTIAMDLCLLWNAFFNRFYQFVSYRDRSPNDIRRHGPYESFQGSKNLLQNAHSHSSGARFCTS